jgi:hypothetical protein
MKLHNLPVEVTFGEDDAPDWKKNSPVPTAHDEDADSEDADEDEKKAVKSTLGFDPAELFEEEEP